MGKSVAASLTPRLLDSPQPSRMSHLVANFSLTALLSRARVQEATRPFNEGRRAEGTTRLPMASAPGRPLP
jgi:hypothetical protein